MSDLPRTFTRAAWKAWYRMQRIAIREVNKQVVDAMLFGTGFIAVGEDVPGLVRHVPIQDIRISYGHD